MESNRKNVSLLEDTALGGLGAGLGDPKQPPGKGLGQQNFLTCQISQASAVTTW